MPHAAPAWPPILPAIKEALDAAWIDGSWGRYQSTPIAKLESTIQSWLSLEYVRLCCSGTVAVEIALQGLGVREGDEVILAGYDFPGNFRAIEACGATPVLVDVIENGWTLSADTIEAAFSEKTSAVIASHLHGQLADMPEIKRRCASANLPILEDACQVPGALVDGKRAGTWGDVGVFSFGGSKLLTAGRGGAIVTTSSQIAQRMIRFADRGNDAFPMSALQAAVLVPQFEQIDRLNEQRRVATKHLSQLLSAEGLSKLIAFDFAHTTGATYKLPFFACTSDRETLLQVLQAEGIPIDIGFRGFLKRPPRRCRRVGDLPNCQRAAEQTMLLHHPVLLGDLPLLNDLVHGFEKVERHWDSIRHLMDS